MSTFSNSSPECTASIPPASEPEAGPPVRRPAANSECLGIGDPARSPGVVNLLIWYYSHVDKDPRIVNAVRKFDRFLLNPSRRRSLGC